MIDNQSFATVKQVSERAFAFTFAFVFIVFAMWPFVFGSGIVSFGFLAVAAGFLIVGFVRPSVLSLPNRLWLKFGLLLALLLSPLIMIAVYSLVILPTGLTLRLLGCDLIGKRPDPTCKSYWIERSEQPGSMNNQY